MFFCKIGLFVGRDSYSMEANRKSHEFFRMRDKACFLRLYGDNPLL